PYVSLVSDLPSHPAAEVLEWVARLVIVAFAALIIGSGLSGNAVLLADLALLLGASADTAAALTAAWTTQPGGVYLQVGSVVLGLGLLAVACLPIPGVPT